MAQGNRNLQAKYEKACRQKHEAAHLEFSKHGYATSRPFEADNYRHVPAKVARPVKPSERRMVSLVGGGNGGSHKMWSLFASDVGSCRVIRGGVVVA